MITGSWILLIYMAHSHVGWQGNQKLVCGTFHAQRVEAISGDWMPDADDKKENKLMYTYSTSMKDFAPPPPPPPR